MRVASMMPLKALFPKFEIDSSIVISSLENDSRKADKDSLFIAYIGFEVDVHNYINDAYGRGCRNFLIDGERTPAFQKNFPDALFIPSDDLKMDMSKIALQFYHHPDHSLILIGITGTNGKTTTATLINQSLRAMGEETAFFGTVEWLVGDQSYEAQNTTPDFLTLIKLLHQAVKSNIRFVVMEVASHALSLGRVEGLNFDYAAFTNLTQDHLDYHGSLEEYFMAKSRLFVELLADSNKRNKRAFINGDDPYGQRLLRVLGERGIPSDSLSLEGKGLFNARDIQLSTQGIQYTISYHNKLIKVQSSLLGHINVENTIMAYAILDKMGFDENDILKSIAQAVIPGRLQKIIAPNGVVFLVDYSHTPDALVKAIDVVNSIIDEGKRSIVVFGAGGDRDKTKRPLMAKASEKADIVIVTSDNPRTEDPDTIINDIMAGFTSSQNIYKEIDRRDAITLAYEKAQKGDVILVAGKGHEDYQIIGKTKFHFSDVEEIKKLCTTP